MEKANSILLADDSHTFLMYVGILVKRLGYNIYLARDGVEAIKLAKEKKPSIIVLDYMMPKIDGSSCLSIIRSDPELRNTPVLILTSSGGESTRDEFERLGCCGFLNKPINISEFYRVINECLKHDNKGMNKRKNIRAPLSLRVFIEYRNETRELTASAMSVEGMYLRTVAPFEVGTELNVVFNIDYEDPVELRSKVIYNNRLSTEIEPEPGMGIKFLDIPEDVRYRLSYFIVNHITSDLTLEGQDIYKDIGIEDSLFF
ncbi:MAG: response regulator [Nitrospirota bacterium]